MAQTSSRVLLVNQLGGVPTDSPRGFTMKRPIAMPKPNPRNTKVVRRHSGGDLGRLSGFSDSLSQTGFQKYGQQISKEAIFNSM